MIAGRLRVAQSRKTARWLGRVGPMVFIAVLALVSLKFTQQQTVAADQQSTLSPLEQLGAELFVDVNLSLNRKQACATCHDPDHAFADPRTSKAGRAVSTGDDGQSIGDRNAPTLSYAHLTPPLTKRPDGTLMGGFFWDGRADTLEDQAKGPFLNPVEMAMPDGASVGKRILENEKYVARFKELFGPDVVLDPEQTFDAAAKALAAYERTSVFSPFDSKYDRWLRGEATLTPQEEFGRIVFATWNCENCHRPRRLGDPGTELFTNFEYHNIGVPANARVRTLNGKGERFVDAGLRDGAAASDTTQAGKFKVPTLRNIAVTGPYMHNGVFEKLRTAIEFYNKYTSSRSTLQINPETGAAWGEPEVADNISNAQLKTALSMNNMRVVALEAFLKTLTDKRYEHLLTAESGGEQQ
ncbi:MAG TPA: cytochrome c peroxidase [Hyphomicrobium sp.]|nr:cytochrome c peroxidase [Hyphomicrobium sp.]